jgi:hypothetical protein
MAKPPIEYVFQIPETVPCGKLLAHNLGRAPGPRTRHGTNGFRFFFVDADRLDRFELCGCGWAPHLPEHYRTRRD